MSGIAVFDQSSVYLPTKKIGKNNPLSEEIQADNETRQDWNRTTVQKEKSILELLIRRAKLPSKLKPGIDMTVFKEM
jgi:hypothetical protein